MEKALNEALCNELDVANKLAVAILLELSKDKTITVDNAPNVLDTALGMVKMCISKADIQSRQNHVQQNKNI